ncbi:MAG: hypothetical protein U0528_09310 [Anaerolineae bacterium]
MPTTIAQKVYRYIPFARSRLRMLTLSNWMQQSDFYLYRGIAYFGQGSSSAGDFDKTLS